MPRAENCRRRCCAIPTWSYILRLYENQGRAVTTRIEVGDFAEAWLADMNEDVKERIAALYGAIEVAFAPYQAVTVKLK